MMESVIVAVANLFVVGAAWGDLRRQVNANRELGDERHHLAVERHSQIKDRLQRIEDKLDIVNGSVTQHEVRLKSVESRKKR